MISKDDLLQADLTQGALFEQVKEYYELSLLHEEGKLTDASKLSSSRDGSSYAFEGLIYESVSAPPRRRIAIFDSETGKVKVLASGDTNAFDPKWSRKSGRLAFLAYENDENGTQLKLSEKKAEITKCMTCPGGSIVSYQWAHRSDKIAAIVVKQEQVSTIDGQWTPTVLPGESCSRSIWIYDVNNRSWTFVETPGLHWWEIDWCGDILIGIASNEPTELGWLGANLHEINANGSNLFFESDEQQIGLLAGASEGSKVAFIETIAEERFVLAGELRVVNAKSRKLTKIDTDDVDVTHVEWRNERILSYAGMRESETIVGDVDVETDEIVEHYAGKKWTSGAIYPAAASLPNEGNIVLAEAFGSAPHIARMNRNSYECLSMGVLGGDSPNFLRDVKVEPVCWKSVDGLDLYGWLYRPPGEGPYPVVMDVHGGPIWAARNRWHARLRGTAILAAHGVASFFPNPRGSTGCGLKLVSALRGEFGGKDVDDCVRGLESLVASYTADPKALGICGISYGGFVSAKAVTEYDLFSAAVAISPIIDFLSCHWSTVESGMSAEFLGGDPFDRAGPFVTRSPVFDAQKVETPTLILCAGRDQVTPPQQATMFYNALRAGNAETALITYPYADHGIVELPELVDATTRTVGWFLHHFGIPHKSIF